MPSAPLPERVDDIVLAMPAEPSAFLTGKQIGPDGYLRIGEEGRARRRSGRQSGRGVSRVTARRANQHLARFPESVEDRISERQRFLPAAWTEFVHAGESMTGLPFFAKSLRGRPASSHFSLASSKGNVFK